ncbi:bifunctional folylpolyglutamate synthase/dihydrofolate synthase [Candidatus Woesearchaeota archaeon]|nr:bifunctional folylpolyglutamate synthase/dihydrofolate synthase [Candidatus Woesearchaeota archaeon]
MSYDNTLKFIYSRESFGIRLGLSNIRSLLEKLGNPHKSLRFIHIAGTNGKGSCCAMLSRILQEQGYKVGMYTSPHLIDFTERVQINNRKIPKKDVVKLVKQVNPHLETHTFFEVVTALAFKYFYDKNVDFVVAEVGLGGRLDATNVITPLVSVITNVSLEHTDYLGDTIEKIAYEKSGIIKNNIPTVTAAHGPALEVIKNICKKRNSTLYIIKVNKNVKTNLKGSFQLINASTCLKTVDILRNLDIEISDCAVSRGLSRVIWPARMEFIYRNILLDCAHNPAAIKALAKEIEKLKYKRLIVLTGILKDKDIEQMINILNPLVHHFIITQPCIDRASNPKKIARYVKKDCTTIHDVKEAVEFARSIIKKDDLLLITGSIYTVGEAMQHLI